MKNWNLIAAMILVALFAVSCGDSDPTTDEGGACTTAGEMKCEGTVILTCSDSVWTNTWDCGTNGQTCVQNGTTAACSGTTTDNNTDTDNTQPDVDGPICGDDVTNGTDVCDGDAKNCVDISASYTGGVASCKADCSGYDTSTCQGATDNEVPDTDSTATGTTCSEIVTCMSACASGDTACQQACFDAGSTEAQTLYNAAAQCVNDNCATECGGTDDAACSACQTDNCGDELDACMPPVAAYGTVSLNATIGFIYDGTILAKNDQAAQTYFQDHQNEALVMSAIVTGTFGASKPIPSASGTTYAYASHDVDTTNGNSVSIQQLTQDSSNQLVNTAVVVSFLTDQISNGQKKVDLTQDADVNLIVWNVKPSQCLLAFASQGTLNVTNAVNTSAAEGGQLAFNGSGISIYHPTESPFGDVSTQLGTTVCAKE